MEAEKEASDIASSARNAVSLVLSSRRILLLGFMLLSVQFYPKLCRWVTGERVRGDTSGPLREKRQDSEDFSMVRKKFARRGTRAPDRGNYRSGILFRVGLNLGEGKTPMKTDAGRGAKIGPTLILELCSVKHESTCDNVLLGASPSFGSAYSDRAGHFGEEVRRRPVYTGSGCSRVRESVFHLPRKQAVNKIHRPRESRTFTTARILEPRNPDLRPLFLENGSLIDCLARISSASHH